LKAKLRSLRLVAVVGQSGLASPLLPFGANTTFLIGPNGAGKTPLMRCIAFGLGHTLELAPDIVDRVAAVEVRLSEDVGDEVVVRRLIGRTFAIETSYDGKTLKFNDERTFGAWMTNLLGIPKRELAQKGNSSPIPPYMNIVTPAFYVDQDHGWKDLYAPLKEANYVKDQGQEVARWFLNLPPRHRANDPKAFDNAKTSAKSLEELIAIKRKTIDALKREVGHDGRPGLLIELTERRELLRRTIAEQHLVIARIGGATTGFDDALRQAQTQSRELNALLQAGERRQRELRGLRDDYMAEVQIVGTNETAAEAFRSLCASTTCQFFLKPEESYGRRLMFLKDQIKDFEVSFAAVEYELAQLRAQASAARATVDSLVGERRTVNTSNDSEKIVADLEALSHELSEINIRIDRLDRIAREQEQLQNAVERLLAANEEVDSLRPLGGGSRSDDRGYAARKAMGSAFQTWIDILQIPNNVTAASIFDENLSPVLNQRSFSSGAFSGSTLTRIVLAYHAALVQVSLEKKGNHPAFLLLDAPKQQEIKSKHLRDFISAFHQLSKDYGDAVQLVVAAKDEDIVPKGAVDVVWRPTFGAGKSARFLGIQPTTKSD
jgi:hypothetical protein